jgi:hypothetical protein
MLIDASLLAFAVSSNEMQNERNSKIKIKMDLSLFIFA